MKRQIFDDAPKQTFYMISKLVLSYLYFIGIKALYVLFDTTLRTDYFEDRRLWGKNYFENVNNIKIDKIVKKNIGN